MGRYHKLARFTVLLEKSGTVGSVLSNETK